MVDGDLFGLVGHWEWLWAIIEAARDRIVNTFWYQTGLNLI